MDKTTVDVNESLGGIVSEADAKDGKKSFFIRIIEGNKQGSSGYYPRSTLEADGPVAFGDKTHMHINHQSMDAFWDFPAGSLNDLAGYISGTPEYLEAEGDRPEGLYGTCIVGREWAGFIEDFKDVIGVSIKAPADTVPWTNPDTNEATELVTKLYPSPVTTVDFVTHPGANGRILSMVESGKYTLPPGAKLITNPPAAEAAGNRKKEKKFMELTEETAKALSDQLSVAVPLLTAEAAAREAKAEADRKAAEEAGQVDVNAVIKEAVETLADSKLPKASRDRILAQVGESASLTDLVEAETKYLESLGVKLGEPKAAAEGDTPVVPDFVTETLTAIGTAGKTGAVTEAETNSVLSIWGKKKASA